MDYSILLIDDDELDRKAVLRALRKAGWDGEVTQCADAKSGIDAARATRFQCILLDYRLPDGDGLEVLDRLTADPQVQAPVIMLTGQGSEMLAVDAMKRGASDYLPKSEIRQDTLFRTLSQSVERSELARKLDEARLQIERMALYDALTGLGNRNLLSQQLSVVSAAARRNKQQFCVLVMDLNRFKAINDTYGHKAGDAVLAEVGHRLRALGREEDTFYRLGGDEFAAIVQTGVTAEGIAALAQRIIDAISRPIDLEGVSADIGISIGGALYPDAGDDSDGLLRVADAAMYNAKNSRSGSGFALGARDG